MRTTVVGVTAIAAMFVSACGGEKTASSAKSGAPSTLIIATGGQPDALQPAIAQGEQAQEIQDQIFERLALPDSTLNTIGDRGFRPQLADKWSWSPDSMSIAFSIDPKAKWHDGHAVTANDVRFTFALYTDTVTGSPATYALTNIDSVTARDSLTSMFWFHRRSPEQFYDATYQMRILPEHLLGTANRKELASAPFTRAPVGSGPYRFVSWKSGLQVEVAADTMYHRGRPGIDRLIWSVVSDGPAAMRKVSAGEADVLGFVPPSDIAGAAANPALTLMPWGSLAITFMQFNLRDPANLSRPHPLLGDRGVRRALSMAIDRQAVLRSVDSLALVPRGPLPRAALADTTEQPLAYDTVAATRLLDSLGWRRDAKSGMRAKDGKPLRFTMIVNSNSPLRGRMGVVMQDMLKRVGVDMQVQTLELNALIQKMQKRNFDASITAFSVDPSPSSVKQFWSGSAVKGGGNFAGYQSATFDALLDSASVARSVDDSRGYYRRAWSTIMQDAPAIWLSELVNVAVVRKGVTPAGVRADGWWQGLPSWHVTPRAAR